MVSFAEQLMIDCMTAHGLDIASAEKAARVACQVLPAAGLIHQRELEAFERDARVYHLRGLRITAVAIGDRFGMAAPEVFRAIRRHLGRRRAALRMID